MVQSLSAMMHKHKKLIISLVILIILPLICIAALPHLMYLTVPPDRLELFEVTEQKAQEGMIIHLDEQNFLEFPVLEEVLLGSEHYPPRKPYREGDLGQVGEVEYPEKITQWTTDRYLIDNTTGKRKYFEYAGRYYRVGTVYCD